MYQGASIIREFNLGGKMIPQKILTIIKGLKACTKSHEISICDVMASFCLLQEI